MLETYSSRTPRHPKVSTKHQNHQWHPSCYATIYTRGKSWVAEQDRKRRTLFLMVWELDRKLREKTLINAKCLKQSQTPKFVYTIGYVCECV